MSGDQNVTNACMLSKQESLLSERSYIIFEGFYDNMITDNDEKNEDTEEAEKNNNITYKNTTEKLNSHIENKNKSNNLLSEATINPEPKIINLVKNQNQDFNHVNEEEEKNSNITDNNSKENLNSQIENIHKSNDLGNKAIINHETELINQLENQNQDFNHINEANKDFKNKTEKGVDTKVINNSEIKELEINIFNALIGKCLSYKEEKNLYESIKKIDFKNCEWEVLFNFDENQSIKNTDYKLLDKYFGKPFDYFSNVLEIYYKYYGEEKQKRIHKRDDSKILVKFFQIMRAILNKKKEEKEEKEEEKEERKEEKEEEKEEKEKIYNQNNNSFNNYNEYYNDDEIMDENYINSIRVNHDLTKIDADCKNKTRKANFDENKNKNSIRKDNLFNRLKTRLIDFFIKDLHEIDNKKPEEKKEDEINNVEKENGDKKLEKYRVIKNENNEKKRKPRYQTKEAYKNFLEANFEETDRIKNLNINIIPKYREQIKTSKIKYLENIMNNENKRDELIKYEFSEKEKRCQKGKCRKLAYKITETKNLKGMILLTKLVKMDKTKYIKIKDTNEFITVINKLDGYEKYDNELTTKETEEIKGGIEVFESIAKDPFTTFLNHKKRGRKPKNQK